MTKTGLFAAAAVAALLPAAVHAEDIATVDLAFDVSFAKGGPGGGGSTDGGGKKGGGGGGGGTQTLYPWFKFMHSDVNLAWNAGFNGQGVSVTWVDRFNSSYISINLDGGRPETMSHGNAVRAFTILVAPEVTQIMHENDPGSTLTLGAGLDVINLSYGLQDTANGGNWYDGWMNVGGNPNGALFHVQESQIIDLAWADSATAGANGSAVVVKAAGNGDQFLNGGVIGTNIGGWTDLLGYELMGAPNVIFAGALSSNSVLNADGTMAQTATLAGYSNHPGDNTAVQNQFLVVGINKSDTGVEGTSFAAPVISAYAAMVGQKFTTSNSEPTAAQVVNRLLDTARTDTIADYSAYYYGRGEASLGRALAPDVIYGN